MANALAGETSPYLLQHRDNPVEWRPWGPEALAAAKAEGKPILLSVGYAACHWCHVMAHESFEDPAVAARMNALFVNVKVDREERPDLDSIYQQALAMLGQAGGWPLTMFLTPEGEPFWGGTYFPPVARYGRPAFTDVLDAVAAAWTDDPEKVRHNVAALKEGLASLSRPPGAMALSLDILDQAAGNVLKVVDPLNGGIRGAPKFPQPGLFGFLWRAHLRTGDEAMKEAVTLTLDHLCHGGIYDHLGGGFMRYSTDEEWLVPHFEKMLYDNAQLIDLLTLAWQGTGSPLYAERVAETAGWVLREMMAENGAFAATLDADSEGEEGRFYTWTAGEIDRVLDAEAALWFKQAYDVSPHGNWEGRTILHRNHQPQPVGVDPLLAEARAKLWRVRESRPRPGRDDKVLADWNGMMIAALANAGFVFGQPGWIEAARMAFAAVAGSMALPGGRLAHSMRLGTVKPVSLLDDLAHMARAALVLAEITGETAYLDAARTWAEAAERYHRDASGGGYYQSADDADDVIVRPRSALDAAVPSANGTLAGVLARLWQHTGESVWRERAEACIAAFSAHVPEQFANMTALLDAYEQLARPVEVVIVGAPEAPDTARLLRAVAETPLPTRVMTATADSAALPSAHPAHGKRFEGGRSAAYVCRDFACSPPIADAGRLREHLRAR